ncbi:hypothetical protein Ddc_07646 [Ditylenchus destructor]|nr:hypothetical protein Ddc_07646 [Ditylenchus destructor]
MTPIAFSLLRRRAAVSGCGSDTHYSRRLSHKFIQNTTYKTGDKKRAVCRDRLLRDYSPTCRFPDHAARRRGPAAFTYTLLSWRPDTTALEPPASVSSGEPSHPRLAAPSASASLSVLLCASVRPQSKSTSQQSEHYFPTPSTTGLPASVSVHSITAAVPPSPATPLGDRQLRRQPRRRKWIAGAVVSPQRCESLLFPLFHKAAACPKVVPKFSHRRRHSIPTRQESQNSCNS